MLKICFFGIYNPEYSRNRVLIDGLKENGVEVIECRTELEGIIKYFDLIRRHWKIRKDYGVLLVAFPGWQVVFLAKLLTRKKIIFDLFAPLYESEVLDRQNTKKTSLKARYYWWLDKLSAKLADIVLLDTNEHIKYFVEEFNLPKEKFRRVWVGSSIKPCVKDGTKKESNKFVVYFYGHLIPLQGQEYILESAQLLKNYEDILFKLIGSVAKRKYESLDYKNVSFEENINYEKLGESIKKGDVCLGIFGLKEKTNRVIPNKIYDYLVCWKPVITADSLAIRELFGEGDLYLIPPANSKLLAETILKLKEDKKLRENLAQNGYNVFMQNATPKLLGKRILDIILEINQ